MPKGKAVTNSQMQQLIEKTAKLIQTASHAVVFTGAGVSTESGIPDFRSPGGIWENFNPDLFDYSKFITDKEARKEHWRLFHSLSGCFEPNPAHYAIASLCNSGHVKAVITQNIDNLHRKAGVDSAQLCELHGNMNNFSCLGCSKKFELPDIKTLMEIFDTPACPECQGIIKPGVVFFGEALPQKTVQEAVRESQRSDLFIVIGSTLLVYPAAYMPEYALCNGSKLVIINLAATPIDGLAEIVIRAKAGEVLPQICLQVAKV